MSESEEIKITQEKLDPTEIIKLAITVNLELVGIYGIYCEANNHLYVGYTKDKKGFRKRFRAHKNKLDRGVHNSRHLQASWNKYSHKNFQFLVLEEIRPSRSTKYFVEREEHWISLVKDEFCFNYIKKPTVYEISDETRKRMSIAAIERCKKFPNPQKGIKFSEERRQKMSEQRKGKKLSSAQIEKMKIIFAGENNPMFGRKHSEETREKIRIKNVGRKLSEEQKLKISLGNKGKKRSPEEVAQMISKLKGQKRTPEQIERNRQAQLGKKLSQEHKEKLSLAFSREKNHFYGKTHSEETKTKISEALKKRNEANQI